MSHKKTVVACISGQSVALETTERGRDLERRLAGASQGLSLPYQGIEALRVDRDRLQALAHHQGSPPTFNIRADDKPTGLNVEHYSLVNYPLIVLKSDGEKVKMHGIEHGQEPRDGNGALDWKKIKDNDYVWNLGSQTISKC